MENLKGRRFLPYSEMILILTGLVLHIVTFSIDSSNTNFFKAKRLVLRLIRILVIGIKISSTADLIEMRSQLKKEGSESTFKMAVDNVINYLNELKSNLPAIEMTMHRNV
jgi:hypothetical protein